jgi:hypothetical protein
MKGLDKGFAIAVAIATLACCSSAAAEQRVVRLVSVDPPGTNGSLEVLGPNMQIITPRIALTPDGKTAAYRAFTSFQGEDALYKSSNGRTELVGVGPNGVAAGILCFGEHIDCPHLISPDGKRVVFETVTSLLNADADSCPDSGFGCADVYDRAGGVTRLLSTADPAGGNGPFEAYLDSLSLDGSRAFFNIYTAGDRPLPVSAWEQVGEGLVPFPAADNQADSATVHHDGASRDGRRVFFSTYDSLVADDTDTDPCTGANGDGSRGCLDVYERTRDGTVRLVSTGFASSNGPFDAYFGGASSDGSRVFFTTRPVPATDQGVTNLYERSNGVTRLIQSGAQFDAVSTDGRRVFFSTDKSLVPADTDSCPDYRGPGCIDVYELFDGALRLVSTGPAGGSGSFDAYFSGISKDGSHAFFSTAEPLVSPGTADSGRAVYERVGEVTNLISTSSTSPGPHAATFNGASDDGSRVFFTTNDPLVPEDHDCIRPIPADTGCPDVYERSGGVTTLITRDTVECVNEDFGSRPFCPAFVGASADGRRVFFVTPESLVPQDTDGLNDLYVSIAPPHACRPHKAGQKPKRCGP